MVMNGIVNTVYSHGDMIFVKSSGKAEEASKPEPPKPRIVKMNELVDLMCSMHRRIR
jgi:hypothetical protein